MGGGGLLPPVKGLQTCLSPCPSAPFVPLNDPYSNPPRGGGKIVIGGLPSLPPVRLGKQGCEKLGLGLSENYFILPPFLKSLTEGYRMFIRRMV